MTDPIPQSPAAQPTSTERGRNAAVIMLGLLAAALFAVAGFQLVGIRSVQGGTVAEAFDQAVGWMSFGLAVLSLVIAEGASWGRR